ncbi:MAG TPA: choice-of-anchor D domain-containing protein [Terriglobales bacterium]
MKLFCVLLAAAAAWGQSVYSGTASSNGTATYANVAHDDSLYVAPAALGGDDDNDCTIDLPCLTPQYATSLAKPGQTVVFRNGYYFLTAPWSFNNTNSGSSDAVRITYKSYPGESPVISAGKKISGTWTVDGTINCGSDCRAYYIDLNASQYVNFEALFYNGARKPRIRTTNSTSYRYNANQAIQDQSGAACVVASTMAQANVACGCPSSGLDYDGDGGLENCALSQNANTPDWMCNASGSTYMCFNKFRYPGSDVPSAPHGLGLGDVEIINFEKWTVSRLRLQSAASGVATLSGPAVTSTNQGFLAGHRFLVENISPKDSVAVLTSGQWYLDRCPGCAYDATTPASTWRLYYLAATGENPNNDEVIVPQLEQIIDATGLQYVTFSGLTFSHDNYIVGQYGLGERQGLPLVPAALHFANSKNVVVDSSYISHTQGWGLEFVTTGSGSTSGNRFVDSLAYDIGAGGVRIGMSPASGDTDAKVPQNILIQNNEIAHTGQYDASGIGSVVWIGNAHHVTVTHNELHHAYSGAIGNGFKLGRVQTGSSTSYTHDNWITYNLIHDIGLGVTNDFGGVYSATSLSPNCPTQGQPQLTPVNTYCNHIVGNVIHDIVHDTSSTPGDGYNGIGIYNDQGTSANDVRNNLIYRTADSCLFNNLSDRTSDTYEQWNLFSNNVLAACGSNKSQVKVVLKRGGNNAHSFTFQNNIVSWWQGAYAQQKPGNWGCFDDAHNPVACTSRFALDHNLWWYKTGQTPMFATCTNYSCGVGACGVAYNCYSGVSAWQAATGEDAGSVDNINPQFRNPAADDYTPTADLSSINFAPFDTSQAGRLTIGSRAPVSLKDSFPTNPLSPDDYGDDGGIPTLSINPSALTFTAQQVGTSSPAKTITLTNTGAATVMINAVTTSGDFSRSGNCGSDLDAGESCTILVVFTPTVSGTRSGAITVLDNANGNPHVINLSGTGTS